MNITLRHIFLCVACMAAATVATTGCKDHDDELCEIGDRITQLARDLDELKSMVGGDPVYSVTFGEGTLYVTSLSGTVSYAIGTGTPVFDVTVEGAVVSVNGAQAGEVAGGEPPAGIDLLEDGTVVADGVEQPFNAIPEADRQRYIAFIRNPSGWVVAVKVKEGGVYAPFEVDPSPEIASLEHIPNNADTQLGNVEYFPVLVYDNFSCEDRSPVFAYNDADRTIYESFIHGWMTLRYRVNPGYVDPQAVGEIAFDHVAAGISMQSRGTPEGLEIRPGATIDQGVLSVQVRGLLMHKWRGNGDSADGSVLDDPHGIPFDPTFGTDVYQADLLSLHAVNRTGGVVASGYVPVKRLIIAQRYIEIGLAVEEDGRTPATTFRDMGDMYTDAQSRAEFSVEIGVFTEGIVQVLQGSVWPQYIYEGNINVYKMAIPVLLQVPYWDAIREEGNFYDLDAVTRSYFTSYATNTGYVSSEGQYALDDFGFGGMFERRYYVEGYRTAHTNPLTGAPIYSEEEVVKYMHLTEDGKISFFAGNTSSIDREPLIRVELRNREDTRLVMTKLLKINIADRLQRDTVVTVGHVTDKYVPCTTTDGREITGWFIDLDPVYNASGMSKSAFEAAYGIAPEITVKRGGQTVTQDVTFTPTSSVYQRVSMTATPDALPGNYTVSVKYTLDPGNRTATYKTITVNDAFTLSYDSATLTYEPSRWDTTDPQAPYFAVSEAETTLRLEDAFTTDGLDYSCGTLRFETVDPSAGVTVSPDGGKHKLTISDPLLYGQSLTLRAYFTHSTSANRGEAVILDDAATDPQPLYPAGGTGEFRVVVTQ